MYNLQNVGFEIYSIGQKLSSLLYYNITNALINSSRRFKMTVTEPPGGGDSHAITAQPVAATASTTTQPQSSTPSEAATTEPKRRVSIANDPVAESRLGYDNLGYDLHPRRKISQVH